MGHRPHGIRAGGPRPVPQASAVPAGIRPGRRGGQGPHPVPQNGGTFGSVVERKDERPIKTSGIKQTPSRLNFARSCLVIRNWKRLVLERGLSVLAACQY